MSLFLRRAGVAVVGVVLVLLCCVQFQQRLLRHRAEKLHTEMLALQLQPGSFADVQRLQREWGAFGHYEGACTAHHCIYQIVLLDLWASLKGWPVIDASAHPRLAWMADKSWFTRGYRVLGGRPAVVDARVQVRDDRMWVANFEVLTWAYPGTGRNEDRFYFVAAHVDSGSRLLRRTWFTGPDVLSQGFRTMHDSNCAGCEVVSAAITPQTAPADIERFNQFNLGCISEWKTCLHPVDLAPGLWEAAMRDTVSQREVEDEEIRYCDATTPVLVREANDVLLVEVLSVRAGGSSESERGGQGATVRVLKVMKNGRSTPPGSTLVFFNMPRAVRADGAGPSGLVRGQRYFFLYNRLPPNYIFQWVGLRPCHGLLDTPANEAEVMAGLKLDPSAGEPYDSFEEPYTE